MPVGADGATVDFNPESSECSNLGHSFEYLCDGVTFTSKFNWKTLVLNDASGAGTTVFAPVTGSQQIAVSGEAITGATGVTGATGSALSPLSYLVSPSASPFGGNPVVDGQIIFNSNTVSSINSVKFRTSDRNGTSRNGLLDTLTSFQGSCGTTCAFLTFNNVNSGSFDDEVLTFLITDEVAPPNSFVREFNVSLVENSSASILGGIIPSGTPRDIVATFGLLQPGPSGETGPAGPESITFDGSANAINNAIVFSTDMSTDPKKLNTLQTDYIEIPSAAEPIIKRVTESVTTTTHSGTHYEFNINQDTNTRLLRLQNDLKGVTLTNWAAGDYGTLILRQPGSANTFDFQSVFEETSGGITLDFASGLTYPVGNEFGDVDLFYIYCVETDTYLVNHQLFHDGI